MAQLTETKLNKRFDQNIEITGTLTVGGSEIDFSSFLTSYTETDPTVPSHVKSITTTNISNWNTAYGWGNHADANYLTSYTETDTLQSVTNRAATTTNNITLNGSALQFDTSDASTTTNAKIFFGTFPSPAGSLTTSSSVDDYGVDTYGIILQSGYVNDVGGIKIADDGVIVWGAGDSDLFKVVDEDFNVDRFKIDNNGKGTFNYGLEINGTTTADAVNPTTINASGTITTSAAVAFNLTNTGSGTYDKTVVYNDDSNGLLIEGAWATDGLVTRNPITLTWRGGIGYGGLRLNGNTKLYTNDSGLGIDFTNPTVPLAIQSNTSANAISIIGRSDNIGELNFMSSGNATLQGRVDGRSSGHGLGLWTWTNDMKFYSNGVEAIAIRTDASTDIWHGSTYGYTSFEAGNETNFYLANGTASTMNLNWNQGTVNLSKNSLLAQSGRVYVNQTGNITSQALQVNGFIDQTDTSAAFRLYNGSTFIGGIGNGNWAFGATWNGYYSIYANSSLLLFNAGGGNSPTMALDNNGRLGIGTTSPNSQLHINESTANTNCAAIIQSASWDATLQLQNANGTWEILNDYTGLGTTGALAFYNSGYRMVIDNTGKVGIGTTSPNYKLDITTTSTEGAQIALRNTSTGDAGIYFDASNGDLVGSDYWWIGQRNNLDFVISGSGNAGNLNFDVGGSFKMQINTNGNVGIGTTSPSEKLDVYGGDIRVRDSAGSGGAIHGYDSNHSIYFREGGVDSINYYEYGGNLADGKGHKFYTGGVKGSQTLKMQIANDGTYISGNVGIGTTSPSDKLTVSGSGNMGIRIDNTGNLSTDYNAIRFYQSSAEKGVIFTNQEDLHIKAPSGDVLLQATSGNVGIGTTSPSAKLEVYSSSGDADIILQSTSQTLRIDQNSIRTTTNHQLSMFVNSDSSKGLRILTNGYIGIGQTTASTRLDVNGAISVRSNAGANGVNIYGRSSDSIGELNFLSNGGSFYGRVDGRSDGLGLWSASGQPIRFKAGASEKASLSAAGSWQLATPSISGGQNTNQTIYIPYGAEYFTMGYKQSARSGEVMHRLNNSNSTGFYIEAGSTEAGGICLDQDSVNVYGSSDMGTTFRVIDKDADVVTFEMLQTSWNGVFRGDVIAYGSMSSISDKRIKENIEPYENVLDRLCTLGVYSYNKITAPKHKRDKKEIGVIAQEMQVAFPELVETEKVDKPEDANGLEEILTVDYEHLTAILLQSIKELTNKVEELENKLNGTERGN